jgi:Cohesin domain/PEP-CTERM motif
VTRIGARLAILLVSSYVLLGLAPPASASSITLTAGSATVNVNDLFSIPISISGVTDLESFQFDLSFNPTIIKGLAVNEGADFATAATASGGFTLFGPGVIDNTSGHITLVTDSMNGLFLGGGLTPGGVLATIDFKALSPGVSPLTFANAFLTENGADLASVNGDFTLQAGQVTVRGSVTPVPEPGTLTLLGLGITALGARYRSRRTGT